VNRTCRRAAARARQPSITRGLLGQVKRSHKLPGRTCSLWVPSVRGYLIDFSPSGFRAIECADLARHYSENEASRAAAAFREVTGLRVVIRPVYLPQVAHERS
jgi:hypothetical protein